MVNSTTMVDHAGWWFGTMFFFTPIVGMIQSDELNHFSGG